MLDESETAWTSKLKFKKYSTNQVFSTLIYLAREDESGCNTPMLF
jgi:hypothetical protein